MCMCQYLLGSASGSLTGQWPPVPTDVAAHPQHNGSGRPRARPRRVHALPVMRERCALSASKCNVRVCQRVHSRTSLPMEPEPDAMVPSQPHPAGLVLSPSRKTLARRSATIDNGQHFGSALSMPYARHGFRPPFPFPVPFRALAHSTASKDQSSPRSGSVDDYSLRGTTARLTFDSCTFAAADRRRRSSRHLTLHTSWWL